MRHPPGILSKFVGKIVFSHDHHTSSSTFTHMKNNKTHCQRSAAWLHAVLLLLVSFSSSGQTFPTLLKTQVISGLDQPIQIVHAGDGSQRIFVVEKKGAIKVFDQDFNFIKVFHTETGLSLASEEGLLSMAFHPDHKNNGLIYTHYTNAQGNLQISRYKVKDLDSNQIEPTSKSLVIIIDHLGQTNHNGGELHFGADGYLYVSTGDGGGGGDQNNYSQNTQVLLGKILRMSVSPQMEGYTVPADNPYGNLVYALGLRNPFRWSFDRATGDIWIGDVGQNAWEEISYIPASAAKGANFGWRCYEGFANYNINGCVPGSPSPYTPPVYAYPVSSVIGSLVYRGPYAAMRGFHFAADHYTGNFYITGRSTPASPWVTDIKPAFITRVSDFGENESGEMFAVSLNLNAVFHIYTDDIPLPVNLINFSGTTTDEGVQLQWNTGSEISFNHFDVEFSLNGRDFIPAGKITGSASASSYQFTHHFLHSGSVYYRLKMVDDDNSVVYSKIVTIELSSAKTADMPILPNLINNGLLSVSMKEGWNTLELWTTQGVLVMTEELSGSNGSQSISIGSLQQGLYMARLTNGRKVIYQKIVVMK